MLGQFGIILVMGLHHAPLVAITLASGLASIPRPLIEAARLEGASPWQVVRYIMLPLLKPFLLTAALLVFVAGTGNFGIPALLGLPVGYVTLPTLLFRKLASFGPGAINDAAAISVLIAAIACTGVVAAGLVLARAQNRLESDHRLEPFWDLGRWRPVMEVAVWGFVALTILLPLASLVATSVVPAYGVRLSLDTVTLRQYAEVLFRQDLTVRAFRNSALLAGGAALSLAAITLVSAYVLDRVKPKARAAALRGDRAALCGARHRAGDCLHPFVHQAAAADRGLDLRHALDHPVCLSRAVLRHRAETRAGGDGDA